MWSYASPAAAMSSAGSLARSSDLVRTDKYQALLNGPPARNSSFAANRNPPRTRLPATSSALALLADLIWIVRVTPQCRRPINELARRRAHYSHCRPGSKTHPAPRQHGAVFAEGTAVRVVVSQRPQVPTRGAIGKCNGFAHGWGP